MKNTVATFCLVGATLALSACGTGAGYSDIEPPYTLDRTATHAQHATISAPTAVNVATPRATTPSYVAPAEKVFQRAQSK